MRRSIGMLTAAGLLGAIVVAVAPQAAGASVVVTGSGTTVTATATGAGELLLRCGANGFMVGGIPATPNVACSVLTKVTINGDSAAQSIHADVLDDTSLLPAAPTLTVHLGDGPDFVADTKRADTLDMGPGDDVVTAQADGAPNTTTTLGTGSNTFVVAGTLGNDTLTATSTNANVSVAATTASGNRTFTATSVSTLQLYGSGGNDTVDASGVTAASAIGRTDLDSGGGTDHLIASPKGSNMSSDPSSAGVTTFDGGPGNDTIGSYHEGDVIHAGGGHDHVQDDFSLHSGGRTLTASGTLEWEGVLRGSNDTVARIRPAAAGSATLVGSLNRPGIQPLPSAVNSIESIFGYVQERPDLSLLDVVIPGTQQVTGIGDDQDDDLADITIPTGAWTETGTAATTLTIDPADAAWGTVTLINFGPVSIHGPWTDLNDGFAHRATRDLVYRFLSPTARTTLATQLAAGTKTRASVAQSLIFSDEYRGLDVDRIFRRYLKRSADPSGRTYWINGIRNGKSLRKFRAQLFSGSEYYSKAGSTTDGFVNAAYQDVLHRLPDPSGLAYWTNKINHGTGRGSVANSFLGSTEARRSIVKDQFLRFLDRYPTTAEVDQWMEPLRTSVTGEQDLVAFLVRSNAYYHRS